ncbi:MAG: NAD(P)-dependent oxidoreductase [Thermoplasmatales archaeon]|nr:NAD(P)-dependent oxidoreductase [Thermoplasmatales archaeon]
MVKDVPDNGPVIALIGLGKMGSGFGKNLLKKGYTVKVYDISEKAVSEMVGVGGISGNTIGDVVGNADYILTSLPNPAAVRNVYLGREGILNFVKPGAIFFDLSTIDPTTSLNIEGDTRKKGCEFLAVTVGKGPLQAEAGESPLFVGGNPDTFHKSKEILEKMSSSIFYFGEVEKSIAFKIISNLVGMGNLAILAEGYALSRAVGLDPDVFRKALDETGGKSYQSDIRLKLFVEDDFAERFALDYTVKDLGLGLDLARLYDFPIPITAIIYNLYKIVSNFGFGKEDSGAILKFYRKVAKNDL